MDEISRTILSRNGSTPHTQDFVIIHLFRSISLSLASTERILEGEFAEEFGDRETKTWNDGFAF